MRAEPVTGGAKRIEGVLQFPMPQRRAPDDERAVVNRFGYGVVHRRGLQNVRSAHGRDRFAKRFVIGPHEP